MMAKGEFLKVQIKNVSVRLTAFSEWPLLTSKSILVSFTSEVRGFEVGIQD